MKILVFFTFWLNVVSCARILVFTFVPSISHQNVFRSVWKHLSLRGHEVVAVATDPIGDSTLTNLTEIDISVGYEIFKDHDYSHMGKSYMGTISILENFLNSFLVALDLEMSTPEFRELLKKPSNYFDLIIVESIQPVVFGIQHKFKAPMIAMTSLDSLTNYHSLFGNSIHPVLYPEFVSNLPGRISHWTLLEKVESLYTLIGLWMRFKYKIYPSADELARKHFGYDMPYIEDFVKNSSLMMLNISPVFSHRRPIAPNVVEYHNVHIEAQNLSQFGTRSGCHTTDPIGDSTLTNLTEINVSVGYEIFKKYDFSHMGKSYRDTFSLLKIFLDSFLLALELEICTPEFQDLLQKPSDYFDLIIVESVQPAAFGIQHKFKAPMVAMSTLDTLSNFHNIFGNSIHPVLYPEILSDIPKDISHWTLYDRVESLYTTIGIWMMQKFIIQPSADKIARKHFGHDMPYIEEMMKNSSLLLLNISPAFSIRRPVAPNTVLYHNVHIEHNNHALFVSLTQFYNFSMVSTFFLYYFSLLSFHVAN
ncbi:hypothetical protein WA026_018373 [Henosepilachna vigintioctopunctata]|uniref:Uncharacterized protein n=1 Tax=Henosepilachna vigintioctopunctata TaxID=420089 RepID=A0AAW1VHB3_9CUCU